MADQWLTCSLDEEGVQLLNQWNAELVQLDQDVLALESQLDTQLTQFNAVVGTQATLTLGTAATQNRLVLTAVEPGTSIHEYTLVLQTVGPNQPLKILPSSFAGPLTDPTEQTFRDQKLIYVQLATSSWPLTGPKALAEAFTAAGYDALFTSQYPDYQEIVMSPWVTLLYDAALPTSGPARFSGGTDAAVTAVLNHMNTLFAAAGMTPEEALQSLGIPVVATGASSAEALSQIGVVLQLQSGTLLKITGENLTALRSLWGLTDTPTVIGLLPGTYGMPVVVWTKEVTTTTQEAACDGGRTRTETKTVIAAAPDTKPSSTEGLVPKVWWLGEIKSSVDSLTKLTRLGLSDTQIALALDASYVNTYVIPEPSLVMTLGLSSADFTELMELSTVAGVTGLSTEAALASLPPATPANGYVSGAFNLEGGDKLKNLSPAASMVVEIQAFNASECIDPFGKGIILSFVNAASSMIDTVLRIVERIRGKVKDALNKVSKILALIDKVLSVVRAVACVFDLDLSVGTPSLRGIKVQMKFFVPQVKAILSLVDQIMKTIIPKVCQVQAAIMSLISAALSGSCVPSPLTNALVNKLGSLLKDLLKKIPCIENPFDAIGMFQQLLDKVGAIGDLISAMVNDLVKVMAKVSAMLNMEEQPAPKAATEACLSGPLAAMVQSIKQTFGA